MNMKDFFKKLNEEDEKTFRCPNCGSKVLKKTKYCVKCKKKVNCPDEQSEEVKKASYETTQD
jgi:uncharacterized OB-fold protein